MNNSKYLPQIDGLRALAVLSVLFFHLNITGFKAGFIGVDIFFVISGFLITRLIKNEMQNFDHFSFSRFFERRARRLLPSLVFTILLTLILGFIVFPHHLFERLGGSAIHALLGLANFFYWNEAGYFDAAAVFKPLLHTWSLGVEEQFYIFWPFIFYFLFKNFSKKILLLSLGLIFLSSLICQLGFSNSPTTIFYLMPFRAYEFMLGAFILWLPPANKIHKALQEVLVILGLCFIGLAMSLLNTDIATPIYYLMLPCLGAALVIYAGENSSLARFLRTKILVFLGNISYSLYLIHWPVIVFYSYWRVHPLDHQEKIVLGLSSILLAYLQFRFIESPFRLGSHKKTQVTASQFGLRMTIIILPLILISSYIWNGKVIKNSNKALISDESINADFKKLWGTHANACMLGKHIKETRNGHYQAICKPLAATQVLTVGNSREPATYLLFHELFANNNDKVNLVFSASHSRASEACGFEYNKALPFHSKNPLCQNVANILNDIQYIGKHFDVIVLGAIRPLSLGKNFLDYVASVQKSFPNIKVIIHGSFITVTPQRCVDLVNHFNDLNICKDKAFASNFNPQEEQQIRQQYPDLKFSYIDRVGLFCENHQLENCEMSTNAFPIMLDGHHFSTAGVYSEVYRVRRNKKLFKQLSQDISPTRNLSPQ